MLSVLNIDSVNGKLSAVEKECESLLASRPVMVIPEKPARDVEIVGKRALPEKTGLQSAKGQARLLHDLANIELQAMELGLRTLYEFPEAPDEFRKELVSVVLDEARHLGFCLRGISELGFRWGTWPVHLTLWNSVNSEDTLLDRMLIVHCFLEASGLDSGDMLLRKLSGVTNTTIREIVSLISFEEERHVRFGLDWYRKFCSDAGLDPACDFRERLNKLITRIPARAAQISRPPRQRAGFTDDEIDFVEQFSRHQRELARRCQ